MEVSTEKLDKMALILKVISNYLFIGVMQLGSTMTQLQRKGGCPFCQVSKPMKSTSISSLEGPLEEVCETLALLLFGRRATKRFPINLIG